MFHMVEDYLSLLKEILPHFAIFGNLEAIESFGTGHINRTYRSSWNMGGYNPVRYTHQRINERIFLHPDAVMENIVRITSHIAKKLNNTNIPDWKRRVLTVVPTRTGKPWARDREGGWWRTYLYIEGTHTLELVSTPAEARVLGRSVALFQKQLADLGGLRLHETIPGFHDMEKRYRHFHEVVERDCCNRARLVRPEIDFMLENEDRGAILIWALRNGTLPERICHNDTKMNNILLDDTTSEALCMIDLDTVMPGTCLFDVGDLIRTVCNRALEDEKDLSLVQFDIDFFSALLDGYLSEAVDFLTENEREYLVESGRNMTQIMGLRFLTDYLEGDVYYQISYPETNQNRCRTQIALIKSMDRNRAETEKITARICEKIGLKKECVCGT